MMQINTAPGPPHVDMNRQTAGQYSITIYWSPPSQPNGDIRGYRIQVLRNGVSQTTLSNVVSSSHSRTVTSLQPHTRYTYRIAARTSAGYGPYSNEYSITTLEAGETN